MNAPIIISDASPTPKGHMSVSEAKLYYKGLPSQPPLLATTKAGPYEEPWGLEAYAIVKKIRIVGNHPLAKVWEDDVAFKIHDVLDARGVNWTSTDVIRIGVADEASSYVVIWAGVEPGSLHYEDASIVALECRDVLSTYGIHDVEVEIRESCIIQVAGPRFFDFLPIRDPIMKLYHPLTPDCDRDPIAKARQPFGATLGISICAQSMPEAEGTGGFFLSAGGDNKKIYLVTARHVLLNKEDNKAFDYRNSRQPRYDVLVLSNSAFTEQLAAIDGEIEKQYFNISLARRRFSTAGQYNSSVAEKELEYNRLELERAQESVDGLIAFRSDISKNWTDPQDRVLGHLVFAPPVSLSIEPGKYTLDFAIVEIDAGKLDNKNFSGNVIDISMRRTTPFQFRDMLYPNPTSRRNLKFPDYLPKKLQGQTPECDLRKHPQLDDNNEPCLMVYKRGAKSGVTIGRASNVCSYTRRFFEGQYKKSREWAILPYEQYSPFSVKGDSGSVIVDAFGRIGGLLTSGTGAANRAGVFKSCDITYATPIGSIMDVLHATEAFKLAHLNPEIDA